MRSRHVEARVSRARCATAAGAGRRFGAPNTTRTAAPTATRRDAASSELGTPRRCRRPPSTTHERRRWPTSVARRHDRESHGLPTIVAAAAPATYASDGKRVEATHVPLHRVRRAGRGGRGTRSSERRTRPRRPRRRARRAPSRRQRCCRPASTTTTAGHERARRPGRAPARTRGPRRGPRPRPARGRSVTPCARRRCRAGAADDEHDRGHAPHDQAHDVARMAEVPLAGRRARRRARRPSGGTSDGAPVADGRGHVVPSRATAATTRSSSTCRRAGRRSRGSRTGRCAATVGPGVGGDEQQRRRRRGTPRRRPTSSAAVDERAQDPPAVLVDDAADAQVAAAGERQDAVDAIGQAAQVRQRGQQLVADHRRRRSIGRARSTSSVSVAAATSDSPGASTRSVPSSVTSARDSTTRSPGSRMPNCDEHARPGPAAPSGRPRRSAARARPSAGRARARAARATTVSVTSATRSMPSRSRLTSRASERGEHVDDRRLLDRVEPADRAEVDQPERAVARRRRCCPGADRRGRSRSAAPGRASSAAAARRAPCGRSPDASSCVGVGDGEAFEPLLHEQPAGAELAVDLRDPHAPSGAEQHAPSRPSRRPRAGSRARRAGCARTGRAPRRSARPGRTPCAAARRRRAARARRGRAPSPPRCRAAAPSRRPARRIAAGRGRSGRSTRPRAAPSRTRRTPSRRRRRARPRAPAGSARPARARPGSAAAPARRRPRAAARSTRVAAI